MVGCSRVGQRTRADASILLDSEPFTMRAEIEVTCLDYRDSSPLTGADIEVIPTPWPQLVGSWVSSTGVSTRHLDGSSLPSGI